MPFLWDSKVKCVTVSQFGGLTLWFSFGSVSGPFTTPSLIVSLWGRKKREWKEKK